MELNKTEQDLVIFSHLEIHRQLPTLKNQYSKENEPADSKNEKTLMRQNVKYSFAGLIICREMYFLLHNMGTKGIKI